MLLLLFRWLMRCIEMASQVSVASWRSGISNLVATIEIHHPSQQGNVIPTIIREPVGKRVLANSATAVGFCCPLLLHVSLMLRDACFLTIEEHTPQCPCP
jgi:hypothetical protein